MNAVSKDVAVTVTVTVSVSRIALIECNTQAE